MANRAGDEMIEKEIDQFWAAYVLALGASNFELARFLVKVAVEYSFLAGVTGPFSAIETDSYRRDNTRHGLSLETEVERIIGTLREAERHADKEFVLNAFQRLLKRVHTKGEKAAGKTLSDMDTPTLSPQVLTMDGDR